jgi:ketosteroid isomerase-like protein
MRRVFPVLIVAIAVSSCASTVNVEQEKAALMARDAEWSRTLPDMEKFASYLTEDATFASPGMPVLTGRKAIADGLAPMTKAPGFKLTWTANSAEVGNDVGITTGTYEMTMHNPSGNPFIERGSYVSTWKKVNGTWMVTRDIGAPNPMIPAMQAMVVTPASAIKWMDVPPSLPKGAKLAVLVGDPSKPEPFTLRLQMPDGYKIAPHTHPTDEHVTVLSGTFRAAMGTKWDDKALQDFAVGSYANMAATMAHYAQAKGTTIVQVHGVGPFVINYVNPADDPSKK